MFETKDSLTAFLSPPPPTFFVSRKIVNVFLVMDRLTGVQDDAVWTALVAPMKSIVGEFLGGGADGIRNVVAQGICNTFPRFDIFATVYYTENGHPVLGPLERDVKIRLVGGIP